MPSPNPPIQIGAYDNVPAVKTLIKSEWAQDVTARVVHQFVDPADRAAKWVTPPAGALSTLGTTGLIEVYRDGSWQELKGDPGPVGPVGPVGPPGSSGGGGAADSDIAGFINDPSSETTAALTSQFVELAEPDRVDGEVPVWSASLGAWESGEAGGVSPPATTQTGATYTVAASDADSTIIFSNAARVTITLPSDAVLDLPDGFRCRMFAAGVGGLTVMAFGVTLVGSSPNLTIAQNQMIYVEKTATPNTWIVTGGTAPGWTPSSLPGLSHWYDASDAATITFGTGTAVAAFNDKVGTAHFTQATAAKQPDRSTTQNGRPVLTFNGANFMQGPAITMNSPRTIVIALKSTALGADRTILGATGVTTAVGVGSGNVWRSSVGTLISAGVVDTYRWHIMTIVMNGATSTLSIDSGDAVGSGSQSTNAFTALRLGGLSDGVQSWTGQFSEMITCDGVLSAADIALAESYMRGKWATFDAQQMSSFVDGPLTGMTWRHAYWANDPNWTPPADGAEVASWRDAQLFGGDVAQATPGNRPVFDATASWFNEHAAVVFDGVDDLMKSAPFPVVVPQPFTVVLIARPRPMAASGGYFVDHGKAGAAGVIYGTGGSNWGVYNGTPKVSTGGYHNETTLFVAEFSATNTVLTVNGVTVISSLAGTASATQVNLGGFNPGTSLWGAVDIAFLGVYEGPASELPLTQLKTWADSYYHIGTLPTGAGLWHIGVTGQSLANGTNGGTPITTGPVYRENTARSTSTGLATTDSTATQLPERSLSIALYEGARDPLSTPLRRIVTTTGAAGGTNYLGVKKGTASYTALIAGVQTTFNYSPGAAGKSLHIIHGESDMGDGTTEATYKGYLAEWLSDYNGDVKAITAQSADVHAIMSQPHNWTGYGHGPGVPLSFLSIHRDPAYPNHYLASPRYMLPRADTVHLTAFGYYLLGEYHARADLAVLAGGWNPLSPTSIVRTGATIVATFNATSQLVLDTTTVASQTNMGFHYTDDSGAPPAITGVTITGTNQVTITLASTPTGGAQKLGYASGTTALGNLRDSDPGLSRQDNTTRLYNWCVIFLDPVTV